MKLLDYDKKLVSDSDTANGMGRKNKYGAAKCKDCDVWKPTRFMYWYKKAVCEDCSKAYKKKV